ncbi:unnamed protein product [Brassicogethes aeneus]|uniref:Uncharacterized protein n=1 Tax=Brassicogethes aeneus TaxID=1431903 RepID=A0A9P0FJC0_BRAAE|nr:unnamed protein product [Brassicogethes aeneus]
MVELRFWPICLILVCVASKQCCAKNKKLK